MNQEKQTTVKINSTCYFSQGAFCKILREKECENCNFKKSPKDFLAESDKAIDRCRRLGLCARCTYVSKSCRKSTE